jgi:hypothetical protein
MASVATPSPEKPRELDSFYRESGLEVIASPHFHDDSAKCPHPGSSHSMEWIDFKLDLHGDPVGNHKPLVRAWWGGTGFVGCCPVCRGWICFTTLGMYAADDSRATPFPNLSVDWYTVAQIA